MNFNEKWNLPNFHANGWGEVGTDKAIQVQHVQTQRERREKVKTPPVESRIAVILIEANSLVTYYVRPCNG